MEKKQTSEANKQINTHTHKQTKKERMKEREKDNMFLDLSTFSKT